VKRDDVDVAIGMTEGRRMEDEKGNNEEGDALVYLTSEGGCGQVQRLPKNLLGLGNIT